VSKGKEKEPAVSGKKSFDGVSVGLPNYKQPNFGWDGGDCTERASNFMVDDFVGAARKYANFSAEFTKFDLAGLDSLLCDFW
jgi:hypothetical protein